MTFVLQSAALDVMSGDDVNVACATGADCPRQLHPVVALVISFDRTPLEVRAVTQLDAVELLRLPWGAAQSAYTAVMELVPRGLGDARDLSAAP